MPQEDLESYGYIYKTTNLINNKFYIDQHKYSKLEIDKDYFGSELLLTEAIKKYGLNNFKCEIICFCKTKNWARWKRKIFYRKIWCD